MEMPYFSWLPFSSHIILIITFSVKIPTALQVFLMSESWSCTTLFNADIVPVHQLMSPCLNMPEQHCHSSVENKSTENRAAFCCMLYHLCQSVKIGLYCTCRGEEWEKKQRERGRIFSRLKTEIRSPSIVKRPFHVCSPKVPLVAQILWLYLKCQFGQLKRFPWHAEYLTKSVQCGNVCVYTCLLASSLSNYIQHPEMFSLQEAPFTSPSYLN